MAVELEDMHAGDDGWSEWVHPEPGYLMGCCDCGLVHEMQFSIVPANGSEKAFNSGETKEGVIIFRARRYPDKAVAKNRAVMTRQLERLRAHLYGSSS